MNRFNILVLGLLIISLAGYSQEDIQEAEFVPTGKPVLRVFSNFNTTFSEGKSVSKFEVKRVYLGYERHFSENLFARALLDVGDPGAGIHEMSAYVKHAYLRYKTGNLMVHFGLIPTTHFKLQEAAWGYRYIEMSFQDLFKFNSSADLGVSAAYNFGKLLSADVIISNGEGYQRIASDSTLRTGFGLTITPLKNLTGRVYYDFTTREVTQSSIATYLGYAHHRFNLGAEYMIQLNPGFSTGHDIDGLSFYGTLFVDPRWKVFARYDNLAPNTPASEMAFWTRSSDGQLFIAGFEFTPTPGIRLAPNFKGWKPEDGSEAFLSSVYLNCEIIF